jgi:uncharacterized protein YjbI with pentapeptide repeats
MLVSVVVAGPAYAGGSGIKRPGVPTSVEATGVNLGANVTWAPPESDGGAPVTSYTVTAGGHSCTTESTSCAVTGLTNGHKYVIRVKASNSVGAGRAALIRGVTPSGVPNCSYLGPNANLEGCNLSNVDLNGVSLAGAILSDVSSGGITGVPSALPSDWSLVDGYLLGPSAVLVGADLVGANLTGLDLDGAGLGNANLTGADLDSANLTSVGLTNAILTDANLTDAILTGADPTGVTSGGVVGSPSALPSNWLLVGGYLIGPGANLVGVDLSGDNLDNADLNNANLTDSDLAGASLTNSAISGTNLTDSNLTNVDFSGAILSDANLSGATLTGADLEFTDLFGVISGGVVGSPASLPSGWVLLSGYFFGQGANLTGADLAGFNLTGFNLSNAILTGSDLAGANLAGVNLNTIATGGIIGTPSALPTNWELIAGYLIGPGTYIVSSNLTGINLSRTDMVGAELVDSNLSSANLTGSDLANADLAEVNFTGANLMGANLAGAAFPSATWSNTTCPDGTNSDSDGDTCANNLTS